ncbi:MAG: hypothetical protein DRG78_18165 [Epsilonproteobacteria bacterium]|nr:MAG: hypothetical protein DRG78_18165 [Campylobacterota bacterium]
MFIKYKKMAININNIVGMVKVEESNGYYIDFRLIDSSSIRWSFEDEEERNKNFIDIYTSIDYKEID